MADDVRITLSTAAKRALAMPVVGRGGYQTLLRHLQGQIQDGVLTASPADVERMFKYMLFDVKVSGETKTCSVCDEEKESLAGSFCEDCRLAMESILTANHKRKYATAWHAEGNFQRPMERYAVEQWANEMHRLDPSTPISEIKSNPISNKFPDVFAKMNGKCIAIEVTELVDQKGIRAFQKPPRAHNLYGNYGSPPINENEGRAHQEEADQYVRDESQPPMWREPAAWNRKQLQKHLEERVQDKEQKAQRRDERLVGEISALYKLFLLIVTAEPYLDEEALKKYLNEIKLPRPQYFHAIFLMGEHVPNDGDSGLRRVFCPDLNCYEHEEVGPNLGEGHFPVFEVSLS